MAEKDPGTRTRDELVNPQAVGRDRTEATIRRRAARGTDLEPDDIALSSDGETGGIQTGITDAARREQVGEQSDRYSASDLRVEGDEVSVRERALKREAAAGSPFDPDDFRVEDGEVQAPDPTERVDVTVWDPGEGDPEGDVTIVGPDGRRRDTGADAGGGEPFFARIDAPDREGTYRVQVGGETVRSFDVDSAGAAVDAPGALGRGWNGTIIDADRDGSGVTQTDFDPDERRAAASSDPDVVAGAGAAEALQAGVDTKTLSPINPISESEGERIAAELDQSQSSSAEPPAPEPSPIEGQSDTELAMRGEPGNRALRERIASEREGLRPDEVDVVATDDGLAFQRDGAFIGESADDLDFGGVADRQPNTPRSRSVEEALAQGGRVAVSDSGGRVEGVRVRSSAGGQPLRGGASEAERSQAPVSSSLRAQQERFGDTDWSAGLGSPTDEIERFTDEVLPSAVRDEITQPTREIIDDTTVDGTGIPSGVPGGPTVSYNPARLGSGFATDLTRTADSLARAPGTALEAAETAGYVAGVVDDPRGESTVTERAGRVGEAGAAAAVAAGTAAAEDPQATTRKAITAGATGAVGRAVTPVKVSRFDVPDQSGTATSVRALRTRLPGVRDRSIVGLRGARPTTGTPSVDPDSVDLREVGGRPDRAFEPVGQFETDVMTATARRASDEAGERADAVNDLVREADTLGRTGTDFDADSAAEVVGNARRVPEGTEQEIADTLRDIDATVYGSAATRAQLRDAREPNDLDIVVRDEAEARRRLRETLEDQNAEVGDVFDIKEASDAPSKAQGGEPLKFGRESQEPRVVDGLQVNPASEELIRKAGASGFFRERGAAGTDEFDVGPQPRRPNRPDVREKDVTDAADVGEELLGAQSRPVGDFRRAFDERPERSPAPRSVRERLRVDEFLDAQRAQAGIGTRAGRGARRLDDDTVETSAARRQRRSPDGDGRAGIDRRVASPSPSRTPGSDPDGFGSPAGGSPDDTDFGLGGSPTGLGPSEPSPSPSPVPGSDRDGSPSPVGGPGDRRGFAPPAIGSPGGGDSNPSPFGTPTGGDSPPGGGTPTGESPPGGPGDIELTPYEPYIPNRNDEGDSDGDPDSGAEAFAFSGDVFSSGIVADPFDVSEDDFR